MKKCSAFLAILASVAFIGCGDSAELVEQATLNPIPELREMAVLKLTDQTLLANIAQNDDATSVRRAAVSRIDDQNILAELIRNPSDSYVRGKAIEKMSDLKLLADIGVEFAENSDYYTCQYIVERLTDQAMLARICVLVTPGEYDGSEELLEILYSKVVEDNASATIAKEMQDPDVACRFLEKVTDSDRLKDIAKNAQTPITRVRAAERFRYDDDASFTQEICTAIARDESIPSKARFEAALNINDTTVSHPIMVELMKAERSDALARYVVLNARFSQQELYDIASNLTDYATRSTHDAVLEKLKDKDLLAELLCTGKLNYYNSKDVIDKLDRASLEKALEKTTDQTIRKEIEYKLKTR